VAHVKLLKHPRISGVLLLQVRLADDYEQEELSLESELGSELAITVREWTVKDPDEAKEIIQDLSHRLNQLITRSSE